MHYLYLGIAIFAEVIATSTLKATNSFSRLLPSIVVIISYLCSFYFLTLTLRVIPVGIAYAVWAGAGVVIITLAAFFIYKQQPDLPAIIGIFFIVAGVIIINLFSKTVGH
jgi:small multidrug resistance pump